MPFSFVYAGFVLTGYFKDVTGDAQTGYYTAPVKYTPQKVKWHVLSYTLLAFIGIPFFIYFNPDQWHSMNDITRFTYIFSSLVGVSFIVYSNILLTDVTHCDDLFLKNPKHEYLPAVRQLTDFGRRVEIPA